MHYVFKTIYENIIYYFYKYNDENMMCHIVTFLGVNIDTIGLLSLKLIFLFPQKQPLNINSNMSLHIHTGL